MSISVLKSEDLTASGNIVIPDNCTMIHALVIGSENPPSINGALMGKIASVPETTKVKAVSIHQFTVSVDDTEVPFVLSGNSVSLIYSSNAGKYRDAVIKGLATTALTGDLPTSTSDLVLGVLAGMIGATVLSGDGVPFTYVKNGTYLKTGYLVPGDSLLSCLAQDSGISAGYTIDGGSITHPAVLITAAYDSWDPENHYVAWLYLYTRNDGVKIYGKYDNGVAMGDQIGVAPGYNPPASYSYTKYVYHHHDAVYDPEWVEDLPDTYVPGGEYASINACFVSLQLAGSYGFVPRVVCGN